jgi:hypothetical protein
MKRLSADPCWSLLLNLCGHDHCHGNSDLRRLGSCCCQDDCARRRGTTLSANTGCTTPERPPNQPAIAPSTSATKATSAPVETVCSFGRCLLRLRDRLLILLLERRDLLARLVERDVARLCTGLCGLLACLVGVAGVARQQLPSPHAISFKMRSEISKAVCTVGVAGWRLERRSELVEMQS